MGDASQYESVAQIHFLGGDVVRASGLKTRVPVVRIYPLSLDSSYYGGNR